MSSKKFNFREEIHKRRIDIDLIRKFEANSLLITLKEDLKKGKEDFLRAILKNNGNFYLQLKDDLFLDRMEYIYSNEEETLKEILDIVEEDIDYDPGPNEED